MPARGVVAATFRLRWLRALPEHLEWRFEAQAKACGYVLAAKGGGQ